MSTDSKKFYVTQIIDDMGVSKFQIKILFIVGIAMIFDGFDYMMVSYTMSSIAAEWGLNAAQQGSLSSWSLIGLVVGGVLSGMIADKIGRKKTLVWGTVLYSILSVLVYFSNSYEVFAVCRLLTGAGLGACIPMANTYNSEYAPTKVRGTFTALGMAFMILGWVIAGVFAMIFLPMFGWRSVYLLGGIPIIFAIICNFILPESVMWLVTKDRKEEAIVIIKDMERSVGREPRDWKPEDIILPPRPKTVGIGGLFSKAYLTSTIGLFINAFCVASVMYGINAWTPSMLLMIGFDTKTSFGFTIGQNIACMIATAGAGFMIEKIGRRRGTLISFILALAACVFMSVAIGSFQQGIFFGCVFLGFCVNLATTCPKAVTPELYPTEFRSTAIACTSSVGRIGGALAPTVFGVIVGMGLGFDSLMLFLMIPLAIGLAAYLLLIRKETTGVSLEELQIQDAAKYGSSEE